MLITKILSRLEIATHKSADVGQVKRTIQNFLLQKVYSDREVYKANPKDPDTESWISYNDWRKMKVGEWKFTPRKSATPPEIMIEVDKWHVDDLVPLKQYFDIEEAAKKITEKLNAIIKGLGWYVRRIEYTRLRELTIYLTPLEYRPEVIPPFLYHFSQAWNKERILRKGLLPHKGKYETDFMYPPRVHVLSKLDMSYLRQLAVAIFSHGSGQSIEDEYYNGNEAYEIPIVVFKIDSSKLRPGTKFYRDPATKNGLWTYTHIPPNALSVEYEDEYEEQV
jgi:hypothetical protein